jgi:hypothetical protein
MEPDESADLAPFAQHARLVVKVLFDSFRMKPAELLSICDAPMIVAMIRDPRDEVVSRLHYLAYTYFLTRPTTEDDRNAWLDIFHDKDTCASYGVLDIERRLMNRFQTGMGPPGPLHDLYSKFLTELRAAAGERVHLLRHEDFIDNTIADPLLARILSGPRDVGPQLRRVHRTGRYGEWQRFFADVDTAHFNNELAPFLREYGYPFERTQPPALSPADGTTYIAALIDDARRRFAAGLSVKS